MFHLVNLVKYLLEGLAVAVAAFYIPQKNMNVKDIAIIALTAAATFAVLDMFSPFTGSGARQGAGFGIGYNMVTGGGFEDQDFQAQDGGDQDGGDQEGGDDGQEGGEVPTGDDSGKDYALVQ